MKLATVRDGTPDGLLVVVSRDLTRAAPAYDIAPTLQAALDSWTEAEPALRALAVRLETGDVPGSMAFAAAQAMAPLPRAWQWLDGSAFPSHGALMQKAFNLPPIDSAAPLMYQGMSHRFLCGTEDVALPSEDDGIDFEGEFGIITGFVAMATPASCASAAIRLVMLINDWSLRTLAPIEMKTGFGWIQAKPACSAAPVAVTPDELGLLWRDNRVRAALHVTYEGKPFGRALGGAMAYGFDELIAHAAATRDLPAGTIIGSGTVSNVDADQVGSSCLTERRALEAIASGAPRISFMKFGGRVRMEAFDQSGQSLFGAIDQRVVQAHPPV